MIGQMRRSAMKKYSEFLNTFKQHDNKRMNIDSSTERIKYILNVLLSSDDYISLDDLSFDDL